MYLPVGLPRRLRRGFFCQASGSWPDTANPLRLAIRNELDEAVFELKTLSSDFGGDDDGWETFVLP